MLALLIVATSFAADDAPAPTLSPVLPEGAILRIGAPAQRLRNEVYAIACSPDGKRLAVSIGYHIQILDAATGVEIKIYSKKDLRSLIRELRFTADGRWLVCQAVGDNQSPTLAFLLQMDEWTESDRLCKGECARIALSADGKTAVTVRRDYRNQGGNRYDLSLRDALSGAETRKLPVEGLEEIRTVHFSNDGKRLLAQQEHGGWKSLIIGQKRWTELKEPPASGSSYSYFRLSPDGNLFVQGISEGVGACSNWTGYDMATGKPITHLENRNGILSAFDSDGKRFVEYVGLYDHSLLQPLPDWPGMTGLKKTLAGSFGILCLCETATGKALQRWIVPLEQIRAIAFTPDDKSLLVADSYYLRKLDLIPGDQTLRIGWWKYQSTDLRYSVDGRTLSVWEMDGRARTFCDTTTGAVSGHLRVKDELDVGTLRKRDEMFQLRDDKFETPAASPRSRPFNDPPKYSIHRGPDGKHAIAFSQVQTGYSPGSGFVHYGPGMPVELWQLHPLKKLATSADKERKEQPIKLHPFEGFGISGARAYSIGFSDDGRLYAWCESDGSVHVWTLPDGNRLLPWTLDGANGSGAFSRDGRLLACGSKTGLYVYEIATGSVRRTIAERIAEPSGVAFSPDGTRLCSSHHDTSMLVWRLTPAIENAEWTDAAFEPCWKELGEARGANAVGSMQRLLAHPVQSVTRLRERLLTLVVPDPDPRIRALIEQLTDDTFRIRRDAELELTRIGPPAIPLLEKAIKATNTEDLASRAKKVIERIRSNYPAPPVERMQALRGVEVLEQIGNQAARNALNDLARSAQDREIQRDAAKSLKRLKR